MHSSHLHQCKGHHIHQTDDDVNMTPSTSPSGGVFGTIYILAILESEHNDDILP